MFTTNYVYALQNGDNECYDGTTLCIAEGWHCSLLICMRKANVCVCACVCVCVRVCACVCVCVSVCLCCESVPVFRPRQACRKKACKISQPVYKNIYGHVCVCLCVWVVCVCVCVCACACVCVSRVYLVN